MGISGVSFDKADGAMWLKFDVQPTANPTPDATRAAKLADPGFGRVFTDHMVIVRYSQSKGWHDARIESRANFPLDPALAVLHYAQEIFEGLKAYKRDDGGVNLFRPDANARRFLNSADRLAMAPADNLDSPIDRYATESAGEYFAVVSELHYSQPALLRQAEPAIADLLETFYGRSPAEGHEPPGFRRAR